MVIDEFTFPTTNPNTSPIDSPPLWRLSPTASPTPSHEQRRTREDDQSGNRNIRRSCSYLEGRCLMKRSKMGGGNTTNNALDDQDQEKMDMLWEDLNYEELFKNSSKHEYDSRNKIEFHGKYSKGSNDMAEFGCVPTPFKLVRTKGGSSKKTSFLVLVKVLKRLFVLQQSAKKRPY